MKEIDRDTLITLLKERRVKPRLIRDIRFVPAEISHWSERELLAIFTKSGNGGVLLIELDAILTVLPFERGGRIVDTRTGRSKPVTCDFCKTWQRGTNAAMISFPQPDGSSKGFLCCADLNCSLHVRDLTPQATLSRTQLHEDIQTEGRVARLRKSISNVLASFST